VNASLREMNGSRLEDNDRVHVGEVSLQEESASFALERAKVAFLRAAVVEGRAALRLKEGARARVRKTVRRAAAAVVDRSGALQKDEGAGRSETRSSHLLKAPGRDFV
jgi:hypothetical protein